MADTTETKEPRPEHMRRRIGISRRDLLRRGAIVGGTLVWTVPIMNSISQAHKAKGSPLFVCCWCKPFKKNKNYPGGPGACETSGAVDDLHQCHDFCESQGYPPGHGKFHSSATGPIACTPEDGCAAHDPGTPATPGTPGTPRTPDS